MTTSSDSVATLLMTDLEGSAAKWERSPQSMRQAMMRHDEIAQEVIRHFRGRMVKPRGEGDSLFTVFSDPLDAVLAAIALQQAFASEPWPGSLRLETRIGIHSGPVNVVDEDLYGPTVNRCSRLRSIGHGGQTLVSRATYSRVVDHLPLGVSLRDLGIHRLRDLQEPEWVFQLESGETREFPPLRSLDSRPHNLPQQSTTFLGRESELETIQQALQISRLVSLIGPGGCGKTRLAIQAAAEHRDPFRDGVWFVDLTSHDSEAGLSVAIAETVSGHATGSDPLAALETIPESLLVLDNAEHAIGPVSKVVSRILARVPRIRLLVTSREPLRIAGESQIRVSPFTVPDSECAPEEAAQNPSVQLFLDRMAIRGVSLEISGENVADIVRICRRLDGIPLAIEQAAGIAPYLSIREIAQRLEETFEVLESEDTDVAPRHRTLHATIGWSYGLLSADEQALFQRLAVFPAPFTLAAAESVCADEGLDRRSIFRHLRSLVDKSLVARSASGEGTEARFRMMDVVTDYARSVLGAQRTEFERRLFFWARDFLASSVGGTQNLGDPTLAQHLEPDDANIRRAIDIGFNLGEPAAAEMVYVLRHYWLRRGHIAVAISYLEKALAEGKEITLSRQAHLLNTLGAFAWRMNHLEAAEIHYEASLDLQRSLNDVAGMASVLNNLGIISGDRERHEEALRRYHEALQLVEGHDLPNIVRLTRVNLSISLLDLNRLAESETEMKIALRMSEEAGATELVAFLKASLADIAIRNHHFALALDLLEEAFTIWQQEMDLFVMAESLLDLSRLCLHVEDQAAAHQMLGAFLGVMRPTQTRPKFRAERKLVQVLDALGGPEVVPLSLGRDLPGETLEVIRGLRSRISPSITG